MLFMDKGQLEVPEVKLLEQVLCDQLNEREAISWADRQWYRTTPVQSGADFTGQPEKAMDDTFAHSFFSMAASPSSRDHSCRYKILSLWDGDVCPGVWQRDCRG